MNIVHCIWSFNTGGSETMLIDIANEQVKEHNVSVVVVNDSFQQSLLNQFSEKVNIILLKRRASSKSILPIIKLNWMLFKMNPDVVHLHNASLPKIIRSISHGLFLTVHALHYPLDNVRHGMRLIAISDAVKSDVLSRKQVSIQTISNGINISSVKQRIPEPFNKQFRIVQVARLDASKKGQDILIKAVALLSSSGIRNIDVDFIGEGPSKNELENLTETLNVRDQIHFLGLQDRKYIYSHLKDYDMMCHPSRYEGFGLTVAEGMAAKLPVLVSDDGGPFELIGKGAYGMAFKMEDVEDCASKIEYAYNNYNEILQFVQKALDYVEQNYSIEAMVKKYITYYSQA